jgi:hypothetical protein
MKTLTLICNFVLLGLVEMGILSYALPEGSDTIFLVLLLVVGLMANIIIVAGSKTVTGAPVTKKSLASEESNKKSSLQLYRIIAVILNVIMVSVVFSKYHSGSGYLLPSFLIICTVTVLLSIFSISFSRWKRLNGLNSILFVTSITIIFLVFGTLTTFRIIIMKGIKENISITKKNHPGNSEDALLAYLADSTKSAMDRSKIAVWTLGQIKSKKALPVLKSLYRNDPEGKTCKHNSEICQYDLHKAIVSIESNWIGMKPKQKRVFDKQQALNDYTICRKLGDEWLAKLDSSNYNHILSIKSIRDEDRLKISSGISEIRIEFGKINHREFIGSHLWLNKMLITYLPDADETYLTHINAARSEDGFYIVDPKYFGLSSAGQMFSGFPGGDYVILMYKDIPTNKSYAEEKLVLWHNPTGSWEVVGYKIADEI